MNIKGLINLINYDSTEKCVIIPSFTFNNKTFINTPFIKMGYTNEGKVLYQSKDCLDTPCIIEDLISIRGIPKYNIGIGEGDICKKAESSLDKAVFSVLGKHLSAYKRTYDGHTSLEKIFLPLECEIYGNSQISEDESTSEMYPQWTEFKINPKSIIKYIKDDKGNNKSWMWWNANLSHYPYRYCITSAMGYRYVGPVLGECGLSLAFCV